MSPVCLLCCSCSCLLLAVLLSLARVGSGEPFNFQVVENSPAHSVVSTVRSESSTNTNYRLEQATQDASVLMH